MNFCIHLKLLVSENEGKSLNYRIYFYKSRIFHRNNQSDADRRNVDKIHLVHHISAYKISFGGFIVGKLLGVGDVGQNGVGKRQTVNAAFFLHLLQNLPKVLMRFRREIFQFLL